MTESQQLLADYAENGSEPAFRELVERYLGLVYSTAVRLVNGDTQLAQDVTQTVFLDLARKAPSFSGKVMLGGWLHRRTCYVAANVRRGERRRKLRESEAAQMNELQDHSASNLAEIASMLDEAINQLGADDRTAILLRFFEQRDFRAVGESLGSNEDAARMRVGRALEKLHKLLKRRGVAFSVAGLGTALAAGAVSAAPAGMAAGVSATALSGAATGGTALSFAKLLAAAKLKLAAGIVVATGLLVGTVAMLEQAGPVATATPDALALLKDIAEARLKITSGEMEFQATTRVFNRQPGVTNNVRLKAVFDGQNRRFESFRREYAYVPTDPDGIKAVDDRMRTEGLDHEAAVRAGLLTGSESHHVTAYDGSVLMDFRANDGEQFETTLDDPAKGSIQFLFDPRCLGLWGGTSPRGTVEGCLGANRAKSVSMIGRETVEGVSAWHVELKFEKDAPIEYWIDAAHPQRLVKQMYGWSSMVPKSTVVSKYDEANPDDPIPTWVKDTDCETSNGIPRIEQEITRTRVRYGIQVDPSSWTLNGLNMPVGTVVVDVRIHQRIGYWNGSCVQENAPTKSTAKEVLTSAVSNPKAEAPPWQAKYPAGRNSSRSFWLIGLTCAGAVILGGIILLARKKI